MYCDSQQLGTLNESTAWHLKRPIGSLTISMVHSYLMKREMNGMKVYPQMTFEKTRALVQDILNCHHHYQNLKNTVQTEAK